MFKVLIRLFVIGTLSILITSCASSGIKSRTGTIHAEAYFIEDKDCWCISDEDLTLLYKEASRECGQ